MVAKQKIFSSNKKYIEQRTTDQSYYSPENISHRIKQGFRNSNYNQDFNTISQGSSLPNCTQFIKIKNELLEQHK